MKGKKKYVIAVLPGDGIGKEVMIQAYKIIEIIRKKFKINLNTYEYYVGGCAIDKFGKSLPEETLEGCKNSNAILFGSVGGNKWSKLPKEKRPETSALLYLRKYFNLFINLRPAKLFKELKNISPLKNIIINQGFDILCVRELIGGIYFGLPKGRNEIDDNNISAFDTEIYSTKEIERIADFAFRLALCRRKKVTSVDKSNVLESSVLWREVVEKVSKNYPNILLNHLYIDNATMQLIKNPNQFDVILSSNLFGDILSDECGMLTGSIGMLASASLNEERFGLYEPSGGSAPDLKDKNIANPIAQILSLAMLFRYSLKLEEIAQAIEKSVLKTLQKGFRTLDISEKIDNNYVTTDVMGSKISQTLSEISL